MGIPLCVTSYFSLTIFKIKSVSVFFATLITACLDVDLLGLILLEVLYVLDLDIQRETAKVTSQGCSSSLLDVCIKLDTCHLC